MKRYSIFDDRTQNLICCVDTNAKDIAEHLVHKRNSRTDVTCFNLYRPPNIEPGDATKAGAWLDHVRKIFGDDAEHIVKWCAQRVQHPEIKVNHALVLGSENHGIGKDAMLEPVKRAIGPWNFGEVNPRRRGS
jgi:hypothetical protein